MIKVILDMQSTMNLALSHFDASVGCTHCTHWGLPAALHSPPPHVPPSHPLCFTDSLQLLTPLSCHRLCPMFLHLPQAGALCALRPSPTTQNFCMPPLPRPGSPFLPTIISFLSVWEISHWGCHHFKIILGRWMFSFVVEIPPTWEWLLSVGPLFVQPVITGQCCLP